MYEIGVVLGLLACATALVPLANRLGIPYPILLVIGGLVLGFIPNSVLPDIVLRPDLVFLLFLPPLLYWASLTLPWREFRAHLRIIMFLAVGLVVATTFGVGAVAELAVAGFTLPVALVLGAIVSPPDAVAATAIAERLGLPRRVAGVLEGESLVNDATALVVYATTVGVVTSGDFSLWHAGLHFLWEALGGIVLGSATGWIVIQLRRHVDDPLLENTISLLTPFAAYLLADLVGSSGVLATVATGFIVQRYSPLFIGSASRLRADSVWELINFVLNGLIFILIGLQLHPIVLALAGTSLPHLLLEGAAVSLAAIAVRILWIFLGRLLFLPFSGHDADNRLTAGEATVIAWAGMRGVVSLAAAQSLPLSFPHRDLIIFLTFAVILTTLILQGLTLPPLIRHVGLAEDDREAREEVAARLATTQAALDALDAAALNSGAPPDFVEDIRTHYRARLHTLRSRADGGLEQERRREITGYRAVQRNLIDVQRHALIDLRNNGTINDETLRRVQRDLDLDEIRLTDHP